MDLRNCMRFAFHYQRSLPRWSRPLVLVMVGMLVVAQAGAGQLIRVGAQRAVTTLGMAASIARNGDTVEVDAGDYVADVALWTQDDLQIRAVGGRARLLAAGRSAEGKAIWVVRGGRVSVEGFDFMGAKVPNKNGAGIRFETGQLLVRDCVFADNENGILTANNPQAELTIESSEFGNNGYGDGYSHNLYVGRIRKLMVTGSYFHHARVGHLLKSRAAENHVFYNRLTDEAGGRASYELEFPSGGVAYVVGNWIQQGPLTENPWMVSFGAEGLGWPRNALYLVGNTLVDDKPREGGFLFVKPGADSVLIVNNLLVGGSGQFPASAGESRGNMAVDKSVFVHAAEHDYRLRTPSFVPNLADSLVTVDGVDLQPRRTYLHPRMTRRISPAPP